MKNPNVETITMNLFKKRIHDFLWVHEGVSKQTLKNQGVLLLFLFIVISFMTVGAESGPEWTLH